MEIFNNFSIKEIITCFMVLFAVIDIIGSIPVVVSLQQKFGQIEARKASLIAGAIMLVFLFVGDKILKFIGVDVNSFAIAGAFVIFIIALEMILGIEINKTSELKAASIVPIAFPLVAGAGTLTTTLSLKAEFHDINIIFGIILNTIFVYLVLKSATWLEKKMGDATLAILQKVFGIILLAISIKLFTANFAQLVQNYINF
ncbi:multiple antibiotic resistance protein [Chryseobacterium ginsenosidimutans]|uniref:MarC family protein n=1 Tax=Chryseobacterium ginsenosidimutans TaxID=687846 RepID=UPI00278B21C4|nr:MarC family protein [Chryseobacterium ginsenosidimutans]MDQ0593226.1 multiple antibiotic resistance protein [Chryseobacterium ginsenosidimutans]